MKSLRVMWWVLVYFGTDPMNPSSSQQCLYRKDNEEVKLTYEIQQYVRQIFVILPLHIILLEGWQTVRSSSFPSSSTRCSYIL